MRRIQYAAPLVIIIKYSLKIALGAKFYATLGSTQATLISSGAYAVRFCEVWKEWKVVCYEGNRESTERQKAFGSRLRNSLFVKAPDDFNEFVDILVFGCVGFDKPAAAYGGHGFFRKFLSLFTGQGLNYHVLFQFIDSVVYR